jgi:hypothetical protein
MRYLGGFMFYYKNLLIALAGLLSIVHIVAMEKVTKFEYKHHARIRMVEREISKKEIEEVLKTGQKFLDEKYPGSIQYRGRWKKGHQLRVSTYNGKIITVYYQKKNDLCLPCQSSDEQYSDVVEFVPNDDYSKDESSIIKARKKAINNKKVVNRGKEKIKIAKKARRAARLKVRDSLRAV